MNLIIALFTLLSVVSVVPVEPKQEVVDAMRQIERTNKLNLGSIYWYELSFEDGSKTTGWMLGDRSKRCYIYTQDTLLPFYGGPDSVHFHLEGCLKIYLPNVGK